VTVIDGVTDSVIGTVNPGSYPVALCYNPTDNKVYCANKGSHSVTVIDGATDSVLATVRTGSSPCALCYDSTYNKVYCANKSDSSVTVIDGTTNAVVVTIGVRSQPTALAWNPVQSRVYVANFLSSSISVLRDSSSYVDMQESFRPLPASPRPLPTIVRGVLVLPGDATSENGDSPPERLRSTRRGTVPIFRAALLDISGRKVMDLTLGANDVRALAPGVYFLREGLGTRGEGLGKTRKIVMTR